MWGGAVGYHPLGKIEDGPTIQTTMKRRFVRKISIYTSVVPVEYRDHKINVLDAPGYSDFVGEAISAIERGRWRHGPGGFGRRHGSGH